MDDLTREFVIESQEGLDRMERCLTDLETRPQDAALLGEIFRSVHTIKGTTGFLGYRRLEKLAHAGENLLCLLREGKLAATPPVITGLLQLLDGLRSILKTIEAEENEGDGEDADLVACLEALQSPPAPQRKPRRGARFAAPSILSSKDAPVTAALASAAICTTESPAPAVPTTPAPHSVQESAPAACSKPQPLAARSAETDLSAAESTLRVDVTLLNRMMNLVGELVLTRNQVLQATSGHANLTQLSRRLDMVTADLREAVMKARLQPVSNLFSKVPRLVRDLSQQLGRRVRLEVEGQETELDKSLLEAIKDPLTHAVRNALDHGIETPEVRQGAGKDPEGKLRLRASHEGSHVIIEIGDDGAGIAVSKIRARAIERGLVSAERAMLMAERDLLQLIFLPGFSTAAAVTSVSGRGVGMDVVRTNVEKIGGKVEIDSRAGAGTTLRLRIPLTLAIVPALIVRSLDQSFALPQGALSELVHVPPEQVGLAIEWLEGAPLYRLRGRLLPLVFLDALLMPGVDPRLSSAGDSFIAVLDADGRRYGLVVDGLADPEEIVVKPLSVVLKDIGLYSGATVLGNGDLALILDPAAIATRAGVTIADEAQAAGDQPSHACAASAHHYLLAEAGGQRAAIPLDDVLRIEQIPPARIERSGGRAVINFDGQLLPVEDSGQVLSTVTSADSDGQIIVVVCRRGNRHVGIAVEHVLDVTAGSDLFEAGTGERLPGVTLLDERVTGIFEFSAAETAAGEWMDLKETMQ